MTLSPIQEVGIHIITNTGWGSLTPSCWHSSLQSGLNTQRHGLSMTQTHKLNGPSHPLNGVFRGQPCSRCGLGHPWNKTLSRWESPSHAKRGGKGGKRTKKKKTQKLSRKVHLASWPLLCWPSVPKQSPTQCRWDDQRQPRCRRKRYKQGPLTEEGDERVSTRQQIQTRHFLVCLSVCWFCFFLLCFTHSTIMICSSSKGVCCLRLDGNARQARSKRRGQHRGKKEALAAPLRGKEMSLSACGICRMLFRRLSAWPCASLTNATIIILCTLEGKLPCTHFFPSCSFLSVDRVLLWKVSLVSHSLYRMPWLSSRLTSRQATGNAAANAENAANAAAVAPCVKHVWNECRWGSVLISDVFCRGVWFFHRISSVKGARIVLQILIAIVFHRYIFYRFSFSMILV